MLYLVWNEDGKPKKQALTDGLTIGRASDNGLVLRDFSVSRHHAKVVVDSRGTRIVDLGSTNGVKVNGEFVEERLLNPGDVVTIGSFTMLVQSEADAEEHLSSATYMRSLADFNLDYGLEGEKSGVVAKKVGKRERVFEVLAQVAKTLLQAEELKPVLEKVMDVVFEQLPVERAYILLLEEENGRKPKLQLFRTRSGSEEEQSDVPISRTILDLVTGKRLALLTHDAQADERFEAGKSIRIHHIRSAMCAPLWHRDNIIGVIYVDSPLQVGSFTADDLDLLTALANYAAVAIERARLNERIRQEEHLRRRLERYHSPAVIEEVLSDPERVGPSVTLREITVLFADIVGFTSRCESRPPEDVAAFLNQFFSLATEAIFEFGGTLDKFIGDAVMAFFGAPLAIPDHAERAVRSAAMLMRSVERWNSERRRLGLDRVDIRVAINTGPAVVGDIGSAKRVDYTVLGNTVNVAARLEEYVAKPGQVVLGESTHEAVAHLFPTEHLGNFQLKGLSKSIAVYRLKLEEISAV